MTKKLNTDHIRSELAESVFFRPRPAAAPPDPATPAPDRTQIPPVPPVPAIPERANARPPERAAGRRIITRNSFEIYEDQMQSLRTRALQEKMAGKLGSMSRMVREAIDRYLQDTPTADTTNPHRPERANARTCGRTLARWHVPTGLLKPPRFCLYRLTQTRQPPSSPLGVCVVKTD